MCFYIKLFTQRSSAEVNPFFPGTIKQLLVWIRDNLLKERPELFMQGDSV